MVEPLKSGGILQSCADELQPRTVMMARCKVLLLGPSLVAVWVSSSLAGRALAWQQSSSLAFHSVIPRQLAVRRSNRRCFESSAAILKWRVSSFWSARPFLSSSSTRTTSALLSHRGFLSISDSFEGGNIELLDQTISASEDDEVNTVTIRLGIKPDVYTELERTAHLQYFAFRATPLLSNRTIQAIFIIDNASQVSYPRAWKGSTVFVGTNLLDAHSWRRVLNTFYNETSGELSWTYDFISTNEKEEERCRSGGGGGGGPQYFCYFPPFTYTQHLDLMAHCAQHSTARVESLGQTLEGRDMDCVTIGSGKTVAWIIHRQHPGEPMASYFAMGLLSRLLGLTTHGEVDGSVHEALRRYTFHIVPLMCPDGAVRGHLRTNGVGANLNREWATVVPEYEAPSPQRSPEVYAVLQRMTQTGVDVFVDVHGDEELPFNFLSGSEGSLHWGRRLEALHGAFVASYCRANTDMQATVGYSKPSTPGRRRAAPNIATNAIADRFNCLAVTLEMPFKDCLSNPDPERGWSPNRARMLGASLLDALCYVHPYLRMEEDLGTLLPIEDAYIKPSRSY